MEQIERVRCLRQGPEEDEMTKNWCTWESVYEELNWTWKMQI